MYLLLLYIKLHNFVTEIQFSFFFFFSDLTLAVPITNSMTFIFTAVSSYILGEKHLNFSMLEKYVVFFSFAYNISY